MWARAGLFRWSSSLCAATGAALHPWAGLCEAPPTATAAPAAATAAELAALADWLRELGADIDAIEIRQSDMHRFGVFAGEGVRRRGARGLWGSVAGWAGAGRDVPVTLAAFPLSGALTAATLAAHPEQGATLRALLESGAGDERDVVALHLAVERRRLRERGAAGGGEAAWLALLPTDFGTTLHFSEHLDMPWLRGTTLHKATRLRQQSLRAAWARLEPAAAALAQASGLAGVPSLDDFLWAASVFWSRAVALPVPTADGGVAVQEGVVPGLDFCNHAAGAPCKWTVFGGGPRRGAAPPDAVRLVCPRAALPAQGAEVAIDYGSKGNEELLFLYGFALPGNPAEVVTLMCPLPPRADWGERLLPRMALLGQRGLRPQVHLPAADLERATRAARGPPGGELALALPEGVAETLEVFVLDAAEVARQLEGGGGGAAGGGDAAGSAEERAGMRLAVLTTLARLLEVKAAEMESPETGTGPLEQDERLLEAAGAALTRNQRHALIYRLGQKRLVRAWLAVVRQLLRAQVAELERLQAQ